MDELISMQEAIYALDSEMVSTNPEHFKSSEKFIKFMDNADIASFGKWQWANGFNTALLAAKIQLEKLPSAQQWIPRSEGLPKEGMRIIIQYGDGSLGVIDRVRLKIWDLANSPYAKVVAWMPLPEPYISEGPRK